MRILLAAIFSCVLASCALHKSEPRSAAVSDCAVPAGLAAIGGGTEVYLNTDSHFSHYRRLTVSVEAPSSVPTAMPQQWPALLGEAMATEWRERFGLTEASGSDVQTVHLRSQVRVIPPTGARQTYALEIRAWLSDSVTAEPILFHCAQPLPLTVDAGQLTARAIIDAAMRWSAHIGSHLMAAG